MKSPAGSPFPTAYKAALSGMLASKNFLYLTEGSPGEHRATLTDWELATRLSYFLWNSLPDDELRSVAAAGTLHQPEVLHTQVTRMMAGPEDGALHGVVPPAMAPVEEGRDVPARRKALSRLRRLVGGGRGFETTNYFAELFRENLPLREFLDSNWTMLNPRLALHYGISAPKGPGFQRVALRPEDHRGGILTQAAVLSLTSDGARHRPVHRGVWLSEAVFGKTPPPRRRTSRRSSRIR